MYISKNYILESLIDGEGIRTVIFVSGCLHYCKGCHNPESHNFNHGIEFTKEKQLNLINKIKNNPLIDGITISGGDPMFSSKDTLDFLILFKENCPNLTIWLYTGFTYDQILKNKDINEDRYKLLKICDVLVDGRFDINEKNTTILFRGSNNQRIIDVQNSLKNNDIIKYMD